MNSRRTEAKALLPAGCTFLTDLPLTARAICFGRMVCIREVPLIESLRTECKPPLPPHMVPQDWHLTARAIYLTPKQTARFTSSHRTERKASLPPGCPLL